MAKEKYFWLGYIYNMFSWFWSTFNFEHIQLLSDVQSILFWNVIWCHSMHLISKSSSLKQHSLLRLEWYIGPFSRHKLFNVVYNSNKKTHLTAFGLGIIYHTHARHINYHILSSVVNSHDNPLKHTHRHTSYASIEECCLPWGQVDQAALGFHGGRWDPETIAEV